jgi:hypothetical protein
LNNFEDKRNDRRRRNTPENATTKPNTSATLYPTKAAVSIENKVSCYDVSINEHF